MMRNKEFRYILILEILLIVICAFLAYNNSSYGYIYVIILGAVGLILFMLTSLYRYNKLKKITSLINKLRNGDLQYDFSEYNEGELSILSAEITKLIDGMRNNMTKLEKDKGFLSDVLSDISHQLKTPLTSMSIMIDLLNDQNLPEEKRISFTSLLQKQLERIEWLVLMLLKMAQLDAGTIKINKSQIVASELFKLSYEHLLAAMELKQIEFSVDIEKDEKMNVDAKWTAEALSNILKNCVEHISDDGNGKLMVKFRRTSLYDNIIIRDNGCGIKKEDMQHVFERFYKGTNSDNNAVGIGLSFAKQIIVNQNGNISVSSKENEGTEFEIKFFFDRTI